jgi:DNA-binding beta-propeller fold protein YncE
MFQERMCCSLPVESDVNPRRRSNKGASCATNGSAAQLHPGELHESRQTRLFWLGLLVGATFVANCGDGLPEHGPNADTASDAMQSYLFVSEVFGDSIDQIDPDSNELVGQWQIGPEIEFLAADEERHILYASINDGDKIGVFDLQSLTAATMSVAGLGKFCIGVALAEGGTKLLVTTHGPTGRVGDDNTVDIVALDHSTFPPKGTLEKSVLVGPHPLSVAIKGNYAIVSAIGKSTGVGDGVVESRITVLDMANGYKEVKHFDVNAAKAEGIKVHPEKNIAYVTLHSSNEIGVLDLDNLTLSRVAILSSRGSPTPSVCTPTPDGKRLFVSAQGVGTLLLFDLSDPIHPKQDSTVELAVAAQPHELLWLDASRAFVANTVQPNGSLSLLSGATDTPSVQNKLVRIQNPLSMVLVLAAPTPGS